MRVRPLFAWYDLWIGAYWDRTHRRLYVLPLPCLGVVVEFGGPDETEGNLGASLAWVEAKDREIKQLHGLVVEANQIITISPRGVWSAVEAWKAKARHVLVASHATPAEGRPTEGGET